MRKLAFPLLAAATVLTVSACGSGGDQASGDNGSGGAGAGGAQKDINALVANLSANTDKQSSAHFTLRMTASGKQLTSGKGVFAFEPGSGAKTDVTTTTDPSAIVSSGQGAGGNTPSTVQTRVISTGEAVYLQLPERSRKAFSGGKPWVKLGGDGSGPLSALTGGSNSAGKSADPRNQLKLLKSAGTVQDARPERLDGQQTTHYTIDVNTRKAVQQRVKDASPQAKQQLEKLAAQLPKTTPTELWVNSAKLPVQLVSKSAVPKLGRVTTTVHYTDWGAPVSIQAPPADKVGKAPKLPGGTGGN